MELTEQTFLQVIPPGTSVTIGFAADERIAAVVLQVIIAGNLHVQYEVEWWNGRARCCEWLHAECVDCETPKRQAVGFKRL